MVENDMRLSIVRWLNRNGYYDAHECLIGGYCDVIGCKWDKRMGRKPPGLLEMICIELKLKDIKGVISQARGNLYHANMSFCAMPLAFVQNMQKESKQQFIDAGVGLITVGPHEAHVHIQSDYNNWIPHETFRRRLWSFKLRHKNEVVA